MSPRVIAAVLTLTVFINAALLFSVEPLISKLVLPLLGGTPSVWNTCLVFFQAALLVGYAYAHALTRVRNTRRRAVLHIVVLALSCISLPLAIRATGDPPPGGAGILWLLALLTATLGVPFVMLASGAPILQRWLADSRHPDAANPYFLYAASNLGSLIALLSYPVLIEPLLTLSAQRAAWSVGYVILVLLVAACSAVMAWQNSDGELHSATEPVKPVRPLERAAWVLYSAVPASLLFGVTTFISTDVAPVPLLWVLPLSIYLLTFVVVFASRPLVPHSWMTRAAPHVLVLGALPVFWHLRLPGLVGIAANLIVLFVVAMVCHGELARRRPPPSQLTEFFIWVAVGGLAGGVFNALLAPIAFDRVYEYPIVLVLAGMLLSTRASGFRPSDLVWPLAFGAAVALLTPRLGTPPAPLAVVGTMIFGTAIFSFRGRPLRFGLALAAFFVAGYLREQLGPNRAGVLHRERSFFGVYRVTRSPGSETVKLLHGTTVHGAQFISPDRRSEPLTYYHRDGPSGDVFSGTVAALQSQRRVGLVGLGTGSLACYGRRGERWTYYEIDPVIAKIALDPRLFTFLRDCPPSVRIVLGDARLTLGKVSAGSYDILVLDAFSSDAIPVHLLTREAFRGYMSLLAPQGLIALHISNRHLDLEPVVAALAGELGVTARVRRDLHIPPRDSATGRDVSIWVAVARSPADLGAIASDTRWQPLRSNADIGAWTDDFSNIIRIFTWR